MADFHYIAKYGRTSKKIKIRKPLLEACPQKKGICLKVYILPPKKPHSAKRKVARVHLSNKRQAICSIPGEGHNLQNYSIVLIRGGRTKDLPGVRYKMIRGKHDLQGILRRSQARSKYGTKAWLQKKSRLKIKK